MPAAPLSPSAALKLIPEPAPAPASTPAPAPPPPPPPTCPPTYPHGHAEHVCPPPSHRPARARRSSTSSISLPVRRRSVSIPAPESPSLSPVNQRASIPVPVPGTGTATASATTNRRANLAWDALHPVLSGSTVAESAAEDKAEREWSETKPSPSLQSLTNHAPPPPPSSPSAFTADLDPELAGEKGHKTALEWNWSRWAGETVASGALVPALITQALATGILDATTYADFETFASNQTGNAILLTLSAVGTAKVLLALTAVSFGGFLGFAFLFGHVGHWVGVRRRLWLLVSTFLQTLLLLIAAILVSPHGPKATQLKGQHDWVVLFLFASMSGAQVAMARQSSCQELPTAPMTSTFVDFVADHYLFAAWSDPRATPRNRRILYVIAMIGGSFIGAALHRYASSWVVVAVSVAVKSCVLGLISVAATDEEK